MTTSATRLFLVRHGATQLTAEDRFSGVGRRRPVRRGPPAGRAASPSACAHETITAVYASPLARTLETAHDRRAPPPAHADRTRRPARDQPRTLGGAHAPARSRAASPTSTPPGRPTRSRSRPRAGESGVAVLARALPVLREIVVRHAGQNVLVVSHKATLRLLLSSLLGFDARGYRDRLDQSPACLNVRRLQGSRARPPDAVQRHLALSGSAAPRPGQPVEVVGPRRGQEPLSDRRHGHYGARAMITVSPSGRHGRLS